MASRWTPKVLRIALDTNRSVRSALYGNDKKALNPQSDKVVIANVRSSMNMEDMINGLNVALDDAWGLTDIEKSYHSEVLLIDRDGHTSRFFIQ